MKYLILFAYVVCLIACSKNDPSPDLGPKLKTITYYLQTVPGSFRPGEKIEYSYAAGHLTVEIQSEYDVTTSAFAIFSTTNYSYQDGKLARIEKRINGSNSKVVSKYEYQNDKVTRIFVDDAVDTDATVKYLAGDTVEILYNFSNGQFFVYRFKTKNNNIIYEQTVNEDKQVSSETTTDYDSFKNPFKLLGFTDLLFSNYSVNNKIKTLAAYYSDAFPTSVPVAYDYEYNDLRYPTTLVTTYKSTGNSGATGKTKTVFEYF